MERQKKYFCELAIAYPSLSIFTTYQQLKTKYPDRVLTKLFSET